MGSIADTLLTLASRLSFLQPIANRLAIDFAAGREVARPHPYSLWTPRQAVLCLDDAYVTWPGLVDRGYTGRHLKPEPPRQALPREEDVVDKLFLRPKDADGRDVLRPSEHTTALFCFFAQWFTDSFLRTYTPDTRLNTSNHEIDLCEIYGLTEATADALREHSGGRMKVERHATGDYPPRLFEGGAVRPEFAALGLSAGAAALLATPRVCSPGMVGAVERAMAYPAVLPGFVRTSMSGSGLPPAEIEARIASLYATGVERGSNTILYAAFNALFLREHNRIAAELHRAYPGWDDDRLFQTARNVNIVQALKLVVEEYITHLAGDRFPFKLDRSFAEDKRWYRTNRIAIEFVLLYRWHSMIPDSLTVGDRVLSPSDFRWNNPLLEEIGIERLIAEASRQPAGSIRLHNTPAFMRGAEIGGLQLSRAHRVQPFNAYRDRLGLKPYRSHEELTGDPALAAELRSLYPSVDDVEFFVGLIAEAHPESSSFGETLFTMVAIDAFTQIFTNPLLAREVHDLALPPEGQRIVDETQSLEQIVRRNAQTDAPVHASFKRTTPEPDALGEAVPPGEAGDVQAIIGLIEEHVRQAAVGTTARRDAHAKAHGCVQGELEVLDGLRPELRVGLFAEPRRYEAVIRFSNGAGILAPDKQVDSRGMAIKLLGVPGTPSGAQDFLLVSHPVFVIRNVADYRELQAASPQWRFFVPGWNPFRFRWHELFTTLAIQRRVTRNPLDQQYWSMTAFAFGGVACKFSARPSGPASPFQDTTEPDFLRRNLERHLAGAPASFDLLVQRRTRPEDLPVEDATIEWPERLAPFEAVARITIPPQPLGEPGACENLSFNPWHGRPEHRPLGGLNRARRDVYEAISRLRHALNA